MNMFETTIWTVLGILGYVTAHSVIERLLFHMGCRMASRERLEEFCKQLRDSRSLRFTKPQTEHGLFVRPESLGWLGPIVVESNGLRTRLRQLLHDFEPVPTRFASFHATMVNVGASLGLMGTVLAFVQVSGNQNFAKLMPLAFETTLAGLLISIPASLVYGLFTPRADRILNQVDFVLEAMETEQDDDDSPLLELATVLREELTKFTSSLRSVVKSHEALDSRQRKLAAAVRKRVFAEMATESELAELAAPAPPGAETPGRNGGSRCSKGGDQ